eukprot:4269600-Amphidinium_carterae.1
MFVWTVKTISDVFLILTRAKGRRHAPEHVNMRKEAGRSYFSCQTGNRRQRIGLVTATRHCTNS